MDKDFFYKNCFENLKLEIDFSYGALFYKSGRKYFLNYEISYSRGVQQKNYEIKIPIQTENLKIGYFLLRRETPFSKKDKIYLEYKGKSWGEKIKEFELSNIFKSQLFILQNAILNKENSEKKLLREKEELLILDKMKTEFLANISHELRTPLNSIMSFSSALKSQMAGSLNEMQLDYINKILSSAIHLSGLINDILDMAKIEANTMQANLKMLYPNEIIKEVINLIDPISIEKKINIRTNFLFKGEILLDERKFRQVIYNLIGNAIKFSHPNSDVLITTKKYNNKAIIKIKDYGIGIKKEDQKRIFDKFVQIENIYSQKYPSSGLGLTITKELLKMQNAAIKVNSALNEGSEFIIEFTL